jgi:DNA-directed RNA polymerase specialized sigma24 family protein
MTPDDFEELLLWLDPDPDGTGVPDRDRGAERYEKIRLRIIRIYQNRGWHRSEEVADEALERVGPKVKKLRPTYVGDPALYILGIAKRVHLEMVRDEDVILPPPPDTDPDREELELRHAWLEYCLVTLKPESHELIICFYQGERREKIENRKQLAARLGITPGALSLRAMQVRRKLLDCMQGYLSGQEPPEVKRGNLQ